MGIHFNPVDVQSMGIGLAAFLATVLATFVFISARRERLGRAMYLSLGAGMVWAWFGFFYHIVPDLQLARELRVISVMGIVWLCMSEMNFAAVYLSERIGHDRMSNIVQTIIYSAGAILTGLLVADLLGTRLVVGNLLQPTNVVLAPNAGPFMGVLIGFYATCIILSGILLARRARAGTDEPDRRQAQILFASMTVGLVLGGLRFTPWYGFDFYPIVASIGFPLYVFAAFYSMKRYHLLNLQVAATQLLIITLWTLSFFRMLLNDTLRDAIPDIALFSAALVLGIFLIRSVIREGRTQRELAALTIDKAKSEFVTIAAHQLRTPLSALRWSLNLLLTGSTALTQEQREIALKGSLAADNMLALVTDLLNVSRINEGKFGYDIDPGDLRDLARVAVGVLEEAAKARRITLSMSLPETPVSARYDRGKLALALENLVDNAIKYTPEGGSIQVTVSAQKNSGSVSVADTGIGITPEDQKRLFERFFRSKDAAHMFTDGSGLGLFIAKTIVEGNGGTLTVTSQKGNGTTATITLPAALLPRT